MRRRRPVPAWFRGPAPAEKSLTQPRSVRRRARGHSMSRTDQARCPRHSWHADTDVAALCACGCLSCAKPFAIDLAQRLALAARIIAAVVDDRAAVAKPQPHRIGHLSGRTIFARGFRHGRARTLRLGDPCALHHEHRLRPASAAQRRNSGFVGVDALDLQPVIRQHVGPGKVVAEISGLTTPCGT